MASGESSSSRHPRVDGSRHRRVLVDEIERRRRQLAEPVEQDRRDVPHAAGQPRSLRRVTGVRHPQMGDIAAADRLRKGGVGRQVQQPHGGGGLAGQAVRPAAVGVQHLPGVRSVEEQAAAVEGGQPLQGGPVGDHDAEVAGSAAQRPEQLGVVIGVDRAQGAVRRDDVDAQDAVRGQAERPAHDPEAAAQGEPGGPDRPGRALHGGEAVRCGGGGDIADPGAGPDRGGHAGRVDGDLGQAPAADQHGAVGAVARAVAGGVHADGQAEAGRPPDGGHDVAGGAGTHRDGRAQPDGEVPGRDLLVVSVLAGDGHGPAEGGPQAGQLAGGEGLVNLDGHGGAPGQRCR
jgi:hypothetical protein